MESLKILVILLCITICWYLSFFIIPWARQYSRSPFAKQKNSAKQVNGRPYHNTNMTHISSSSLWKGRGDDLGIQKKVHRKKRGGSVSI